MSSGMVYANPFGAAAEGQRAGITQALQIGQGARNMRDQDFNYDHMKWYEKYRRDEEQARAAANVDLATQQLLSGARAVGGYTGNFNRLNNVGQQAYGQDWTPPQYTNSAQQTFGADTNFGGIPREYAYGERKGGGSTSGYDDPNLALKQEWEKADYQNRLNALHAQNGQGQADNGFMHFMKADAGIPDDQGTPAAIPRAAAPPQAPAVSPSATPNFGAPPLQPMQPLTMNHPPQGLGTPGTALGGADTEIWDKNHPIGGAGIGGVQSS